MADDSDRDDSKAAEVEERSSPSGAVVYHTVRKEGEDELQRTNAALLWSALAAGLSMGFSLVAEGLLRSHLPTSQWQPLLVHLGYPVGFLFVVLGRQQLFTENTLTVILPLLARKEGASIRNVARLWTVVLLANLAGALLFAVALARTEVFDPGVHEAFLRISEEALRARFAVTLLRGIYAGWLIALMVWLMPFAESARVWVIIIVTYLVALGGFSHVIAGSVEVFYLALTHHIAWIDAVGSYTIPALIGNTIGGVALVAAINHAQIVGGEEGEDV